MKIIVLLTILILSFFGTAYAGLDTYNCECTLIYAFRFESTETNDEGENYFEDSSLQEHIGRPLDGASLSGDGKYEKCLHLQGDDVFATGTTISPLGLNQQFSIAAWVKLTQQQETSLKFYVQGTDTENDAIRNFHLLTVTTDGNLKASHYFTIGTEFTFETEGQNVSDNEWHHIAYTKAFSTYRLFINGEVITSEYQPDLPFGLFLGNRLLSIIGTLNDHELTGNVYVDDFFVTSLGLSPYEIKGLYEDSVATFLEVMPVDPQGKVATTWGKIKSQ